MEPMFTVESESKGRFPMEDLSKYKTLVLNYLEHIVNTPLSPIYGKIPVQQQSLFSKVGLLVDIGLKDENTTIPVKFWVRHSYSQLRDYPRLHLPKKMDTCRELYDLCRDNDIHFCVLMLNNGVLSSFWADRYDFIDFDKYKLESRWPDGRIDRICTPWEIQKGKLKHIGNGYIHLYKQFASLIHKQAQKNKSRKGAVQA